MLLPGLAGCHARAATGRENADALANGHAADGDAYPQPDLDRRADRDGDANGDRNGHPNLHHHADPVSAANVYLHSYGHGHSYTHFYFHIHSNAYAHRYPLRDAQPHRDALPDSLLHEHLNPHCCYRDAVIRALIFVVALMTDLIPLLKSPRPNPIARSRLFLGLACALWLAGCAEVASFLTPSVPSATPTFVVTPSPGAVVHATETPRTLRLWLPSQFDPASGGPAEDLLSARLEEFLAGHPGLQIEVRLKAQSGPGDLLGTLLAASIAAPDALPDLIALSRSDLESAALKGVLHPLDGLVTVMDDPDWYPYAWGLARIQNTTYCLPFAGDALVLVRRSSPGSDAPADWESLHDEGASLVFPAADPQALFGLSLYLSTGLLLVDEQGRPSLDAPTLTRVLTQFDLFRQEGQIAANSAAMQTYAQAWEAYRAGRASIAAIWASAYLGEENPAGDLLPLPGIEDAPFTLADGWCWALAGADLENQSLAAELAAFLVEAEYLASWNEAAAYLPPRPSALAAWQDAWLKASLDDVSESARALPSNDLLLAIGPVFRQAVIGVVTGENLPEEAAEIAVEQLK